MCVCFFHSVVTYTCIFAIALIEKTAHRIPVLDGLNSAIADGWGFPPQLDACKQSVVCKNKA